MLSRQRVSGTQTAEVRYLGEDGELTREINHTGRAARGCVRRYGPELFDRPGAPERLKVRLLQAEAMEAIRLRDVVPTERSLRPVANHIPPTIPTSYRVPPQAWNLPSALVRPGSKMPICVEAIV